MARSGNSVAVDRFSQYRAALAVSACAKGAVAASPESHHLHEGLHTRSRRSRHPHLGTQTTA
eukprot:637463-Pyramimonas_sp.AAC.1